MMIRFKRLLTGGLAIAATAFGSAAFGAKGRRIDRVEALEPAADAREPKWTQEGDALELDVDAKAFGYRLVFSGK